MSSRHPSMLREIFWSKDHVVFLFQSRMRSCRQLDLLQLILFIFFITETLPDSSNCSVPSNLENICSCVSQNYLQCTGLNSTQQLKQFPASPSVTRIEILNSEVQCLDFNHFNQFDQLSELSVKYSELRRLMCDDNGVDQVKHLISLDVSHNKLIRLDSGLGHLSQLHHLNTSHNKIHSVKPVLGSLKSLTSLDLSHNRLSETLDRSVLEQIPSSVSTLHIHHNPWPCLPSLSWMYDWSHKLPLHIQVDMCTQNN